MGISGRIAQSFLTTSITPLLALVGLLLGLFAVMITPREEEPQIDVTFANIFISFPGATATEIETLVAAPAEQAMSEIVDFYVSLRERSAGPMGDSGRVALTARQLTSAASGS